MPLIGYIALLQLADLQWMYYWQNDLSGCIFGEIIAIADVIVLDVFMTALIFLDV